MSASVLENYDVKLTRLTEDKIEMVRRWRNDPKISQYFYYREIITEEMQKNWFRKVDNDENYYYIISYRGEDLGLINVKDVDHEAKVGEGGVFIYEDKYQNTDISYRAHLVLFDYCFGEGIVEKITSHIIETNRRANRLITFLGSVHTEGEWYILTKENYYANVNRTRFLKKWNRLKEAGKQ